MMIEKQIDDYAERYDFESHVYEIARCYMDEGFTRPEAFRLANKLIQYEEQL